MPNLLLIRRRENGEGEEAVAKREIEIDSSCCLAGSHRQCRQIERERRKESRRDRQRERGSMRAERPGASFLLDPDNILYISHFKRRDVGVLLCRTLLCVSCVLGLMCCSFRCATRELARAFKVQKTNARAGTQEPPTNWLDELGES